MDDIANLMSRLQASVAYRQFQEPITEDPEDWRRQAASLPGPATQPTAVQLDPVAPPLAAAPVTPNEPEAPLVPPADARAAAPPVTSGGSLLRRYAPAPLPAPSTAVAPTPDSPRELSLIFARLRAVRG